MKLRHMQIKARLGVRGTRGENEVLQKVGSGKSIGSFPFQ